VGLHFKVQAVLLLLGGCELSSGPQGDMLPQNQRVLPQTMNVLDMYFENIIGCFL
jgi:hypothetical protein